MSCYTKFHFVIIRNFNLSFLLFRFNIINISINMLIIKFYINFRNVIAALSGLGRWKLIFKVDTVYFICNRAWKIYTCSWLYMGIYKEICQAIAFNRQVEGIVSVFWMIYKTTAHFFLRVIGILTKNNISVVKFIEKLSHKYSCFSVYIRLFYQKGKYLNTKHVSAFHMYPMNSRWLAKKISKNSLYIYI